ncbi:hypothetical protein JXA34_02445 [Patescibacteria group bacterium]|nr:hypothetical protein [Patescibacteria group bacterium]
MLYSLGLKPNLDMFRSADGLAKVSDKKHVDGAILAGWNAYLYDPSDIEKSNTGLLELSS